MTQPSPSDFAGDIGIVGDTQPQNPTTFASASDVIAGLSGKSKDEAFKDLVSQKAKYMTESARLQQQLASRGVIFDGSNPSGVYVDGVFRSLDEARAEGHPLMSTIDSLLTEYNTNQANLKILNDLENDLFDTDYKWADPSSAVNAYLNSQEDFRKRVRFYVDIAKDFISMENSELDMIQDAATKNAELLKKQQELGVPLPGMSIRTWTPGPSTTTQAKMAAGLPAGNTDQLLAGGGGQTFATPEEWARAAGVPGYAGGTKMPNIDPRKTVRAQRKKQPGGISQFAAKAAQSPVAGRIGGGGAAQNMRQPGLANVPPGTRPRINTSPYAPANQYAPVYSPGFRSGPMPQPSPEEVKAMLDEFKQRIGNPNAYRSMGR